MALDLTTLDQKREREDLIQAYRLMNGMDVQWYLLIQTPFDSNTS